MFKWAQQQLANVAGTQEPIYGPSAIKSVAEEAKTIPFTELKREDLTWKALDRTNVESMVFYLFSEDPKGPAALTQVIYSNVAGIRTTCQFNVKIFYRDGGKEPLWSSNPLQHHDFSEDKTNFYADDCAVELSKDGTYYTIKSMNDDRAIVNLKVTRTAPGFQAGSTGTTLYGTDPKEPWGSMRHAIWPRCVGEGTISTKDGPIDFKGRAAFVYALQGMKPHHAAARWNFVDFQGPTMSAIMMEHTTPPSYGSTTVNVSLVARDGELIFGGCDGTAAHLEAKNDEKTGWPEPTKVKYDWSGKTKDGEPAEAAMQIVAGAAGTKPYIYQYMNRDSKFTLKVKIGDNEITEEGDMFNEATFIVN
ncbi:hypothetical protein P8C59_001373 [Phyllachora maydis]|uniref:Survival factor 1 n=1 Tax=Phyllachora maydis TaxID=1825666 RepID=A0AAD9HY39_9PEZI|nr:hypothetical protein P8C59_001373 [Phyllachora maydis]